MCIVSLADDMTGALEVGAKFRAAGLRPVVSAKPAPIGSAQALVLDSETRHCSAEMARREVRRFVLESCETPPRLIYKKTDSTLRGNIAAELGALAELFPEWRIGYAPAYPALGRTVRGGVLYVDRVPVSQTAFSRDVLNPIHDSSVAAMLDPRLPCVVFDGETDDDLAAAARAILSDRGMRIAAGPAGLADAIARQIDLPRDAPARLPAVRSCLVINGSLHENAALQTQRAEAERWASTDRGAAWRILRTSHRSGASPAEVAKENGERALREIAADAPDAVFVIGGDTAFAIVSALGLPQLAPIGEALPGVPITRIEASDLTGVLPGRTRDLFFITKAGGFGGPDTIREARGRLEAE